MVVAFQAQAWRGCDGAFGGGSGPALVELSDVEGTGDLLNKTGVVGRNTDAGRGVHGISKDGIGVVGESSTADPDNNIGVQGFGATGVEGRDNVSTGRLATSGQTSRGHHVGVFGGSVDVGVLGLAHRIGVLGIATEADSIGVQGEAANNGKAAKFVGDVEVSGDLHVTGDVLLDRQDIAEHLPVRHAPECRPGMVVVLDDDGVLRPCQADYDKRVVGVIAGAHTLKPAIRLGHAEGSGDGLAVALVGTTYCLADADEDPIAVGELLTSAARTGHARKAADPARSFGAVIGKALAPLRSGQGAIPIVIALQ
jgi:hypothetical protein